MSRCGRAVAGTSKKVPHQPDTVNGHGEWDLLAARDALIDAAEAIALARSNIERLLRTTTPVALPQD